MTAISLPAAPGVGTVNPDPTPIRARLGIPRAWVWESAVILSTGTECRVYGAARSRRAAVREQREAATRMVDAYFRAWDDARERIVVMAAAEVDRVRAQAPRDATDDLLDALEATWAVPGLRP